MNRERKNFGSAARERRSYGGERVLGLWMGARQHPAPVQQAFHGFESLLAPAGGDGAVANLRDGLLRDRNAPIEDVLPVAGQETGAGPSQAVKTRRRAGPSPRSFV